MHFEKFHEAMERDLVSSFRYNYEKGHREDPENYPLERPQEQWLSLLKTHIDESFTLRLEEVTKDD